jgi:alpha-1,3-rhamnosyl/mannosyltransferase
VAFVDARSSEALAAALAALLADPERRRELVRRGRAQLARFSWERTARETVEVYREVMGEEGMRERGRETL